MAFLGDRWADSLIRRPVFAVSSLRGRPVQYLISLTWEIEMRICLLCLILALVAFVLGGCAGSIVGDALAGKEKLAQQDDAYCTSIGLTFGTPIMPSVA
jgi:hypothetical protein